MVIGITMLRIMHGQETGIYHALKNKNNIKDIYHILGEFPLFVIMQAENMLILNYLIDEIQEIPGVTGIWHLLISKDDGCIVRDVLPRLDGTALSRSQ